MHLQWAVNTNNFGFRSVSVGSLRSFCRSSHLGPPSWLRIWPQWTGSRSIWGKIGGECIKHVKHRPCILVSFMEQKSPVQKPGNFWICLSRPHNWKHAVKKKKNQRCRFTYKTGKVMPQTCVLLSGTPSVQSVELRCSFLLTETETNNIWSRDTDTQHVRQTHGLFRSNQDNLKLILKVDFIHDAWNLCIIGRQCLYECKNRSSTSICIQQYTQKPTGMMKLVSAGSSTVKSSIHVSRSEVGWAANLVLSTKNRTKWNQSAQNLYSFLKSFLLYTCLKKKKTYWCDFLLLMSEGWQYWTQGLVKRTESVTIKTSMSNQMAFRM